MNEWQECNLGETGRVVTGKTPSKNNPEDWGEAVLFITPTDYKNYGKKAYSSIRKLSLVGVQKQEKRLLPPGSVLVTCIGSDMGKTVVNAFPCVSNQQINAIIPNKKKVFGDFLYYLTKDLYETLKSLGSDGTAVPILNKSDFEKISIQLPNINEQKAIASVLNSLDDKIDLLHRQNKTLEAMAETLFRQWFVEEAQEDWDIIRLGSIADVNWGDTSVTKASYVENGYLAYSATGPDGFLDYYDFDKDGIVISAIGVNAGLTWFASGKWSCIKNTLRFWRTDKRVNNEYLYFYTKGADKWPIRGSAQPFISQTDARNIEIAIPPKTKMDDFGDIAATFLTKVRENKKQISQLTRLRDTLLPKLMSGEVRVAA